MLEENPDQIQHGPPDLGLGTPAPTPLVLIHDGGGTTFQYYLLDLLGREVYGVSNPHFESGKKWNSMREMGETYAGLIRSAIPSGKILLGGWSLGGFLSLEGAHILQQDPAFQVLGVVMIDSVYPHVKPDTIKSAAKFNHAIKFGENTSDLRKMQVHRCFDNAREVLRQWEPPDFSKIEVTMTPDPATVASSSSVVSRPRNKCPPTVLLRARLAVPPADDPTAVHPVDYCRGSRNLGWDHYDKNFIKSVLDIPGHHFNVFDIDKLEAISNQVKRACDILDR